MIKKVFPVLAISAFSAMLGVGIIAPILPIYFYTNTFLKAPEVEGLASNLLGYISFKDLALPEM